MRYIIEWSNSNRVVGTVEYYPNSVTVPRFDKIQMFEADNGNQMELMMVGLSYIPWMDKYMVLFQGITETGDVLFFEYSSPVTARLNDVKLIRINPSNNYNIIHEQFNKTTYWLLMKGEKNK